MEVVAADGKKDQFSILWGGGFGLVDGSNVFKTLRKVCRICNNPDDDDLISVQLVQERISIAEKIEAITGIEVTSDRRLPQNICLDCLERLRLAFELRQQCIETDARLRASLDATQTPPDQYYVETLEEESEEQMGCAEQELAWEVESIFEKHRTELDEDLSKQESCNEPQPTVALSETAECPTTKRSASWREDVHYVLVGSDCFPCCGCTMTFESEDDLKVHSIRCHRKRLKRSKFSPVQCTLCYQSFTSAKALERHRAHAAGQRKETSLQYQCLICNSLFTQQAKLFDHLEFHVAEVASMEMNDKVSEIRIELQSPRQGQTMEDDGGRIDEDSVAETLDEAYSIVYVPDDESSQTEEYIEVDAMEGDDEYDDGEFGDEEETDRDVSHKTRVTKQGSHWQHAKTLLRKEMYQIPEKYLRIVSKKDGYMIVELKQHRCCCCAQFFETTHQLEQHLKKRDKRQQQTTPQPKEVSSSTGHPYTCEYCGKQFKFPVVYHCHLRMRRQRQFYFCTLCKTVMESEKRMLSHMVHTQKHAAHFNLPYEDIDDRYYSVKMPGVRCCGCGQQFNDEEELTDHVRTSHPPEAGDGKRSRRTHPFGCDVCGRRFSRQSQLDNHTAMGMVDTPTGARTRTVLQYYCKLCSFDTPYHRRMELHQRSAIHSQVLSTMRLCPLQNSAIKFDRLRYCCFEQCKKSFTDLGELYAHVGEIHSEALAKNKRTAREQDEEHGATKGASGAGTVECDICGLRLKHTTALKRHQALRGPQNCVCSVCGIKKRSRAVLLIHERTHTGERPYSCDECDKTFTAITSLRSHQKCHQPRGLECNVCQERFARLENLKRHVLLKHGEATHQCQSCPKKFKTRDTLTIHLRTHTGEKPYKCRTEGCDKWYVNVSDRRRHEMSNHTMERPHKCSYCEAAFIRKRQLAIHERRHTGERPYVCSDCGKGFLEAGLLRKHIRTVCPNAASDGTVAPG